MAIMKVFLSHSHEDVAFCDQLYKALKAARAEVWYDMHDVETGELTPTIINALRASRVFIVVVSPDALRSEWVMQECEWAYRFYRRDPARIILPVVIEPLPDTDLSNIPNGWVLIDDFVRIEDPKGRPYGGAETIRRVLARLVLDPADDVQAPVDPPRAEQIAGYISRGKALQAQTGRQIEALIQFRLALQLDSQSFDALFNLGYSFLTLRRYGEAYRVLERAVEVSPNNPDKAAALDLLASAAEGLEQRDAALDAIEQALLIDRDDSSLWHHKGTILIAQSKFDEALLAIDRALRLEQKDSGIWCSKGIALYHLGRDKEALSELQRAVDLDSRNALAWYLQGAIFMRLQIFDKAESALSQATRLQPSNAQAWILKGEAHYRRKQYRRAVQALDHATALSQNDVDAWYLKGLALRAQWLGRLLGGKEDAVKAFDRALLIAPTRIDILYEKGKTLADMRRYKQAVETFDAILSTEPDNPTVLREKINALRKLDAYDEVERAYVHLADVTHDPRVWIELGNYSQDLERYGQALSAFDHALAIEPENVSVLKAKIDVLKKVGSRENQVTQTYIHLATITGDAAEWFDLGHYLWQLHRFEQAAAALELALGLTDDSVFTQYQATLSLPNGPRIAPPKRGVDAIRHRESAWIDLGDAYEQLKRYREAADAFDHALRLDPDNVKYAQRKADALWKDKPFGLAAIAAKQHVRRIKRRHEKELRQERRAEERIRRLQEKARSSTRK